MIARPSAEVRDAVGVNTRSLYLDTPYGDWPRWYPLLRDLGVRWVRDSLPTAPHDWVDPHYAQMMSDGLKLLGGVASSASPHYMERATGADLDAALQAYRANGPRAGFLGALEGPNEPDLHGGAWAQETRDAMARLHWVARSLSIDAPIVGPAISGAQARADYGLEPNADRGNLHPYPGRDTQASRFPQELDWTRGVYPAPMRFWVTETGWHYYAPAGGYATEQEGAEKTAQTVLDCLARPELERVFLHELLDTPAAGMSAAEQAFGLIRRDFTPRPAYGVLRWLLQTGIGDGGQAATLDAGIGQPAPPSLLVRAGDGTFRLILWRVTQPVGVLLAQPAADVRVLRFFQPDLPLAPQGGMVPTSALAVVKVTPA